MHFLLPVLEFFWVHQSPVLHIIVGRLYPELQRRKVLFKLRNLLRRSNQLSTVPVLDLLVCLSSRGLAHLLKKADGVFN